MISTKDVEQVVKTQAVRDKTQSQLDFIKGEAKRNADRVGVPQEITSNWEWVNVTDNSDVTLAIGKFSVAVGSDATVLKSSEGQGLRANIRYRIYIYDYYDFADGVELTGDLERMFKTSISDDMRQLEKAGWARGFRVRGNTQFLGDYQWSGEF
ncbi:hypothetical protein [Nocardia sp. NPDC049707]|uniref:hypothetical protein n=1 Tax=Nocardia sp. NPDC049707 TaxID=3154735 RepID=UPI0034469A6F